MLKKISIIIIALFITVSAFAGSQQTSSTTAETIIENARSYLSGTGSDVFWNDERLLRWLNDGLVDLVSRSHCLENTEDISLIANQTEYAITSTYIVVKAVHYVSATGVSKALIRGAPESVGLVSNIGEPAYWYDWAGKLGAYPALTGVTTEKITVYLVTRPEAIIISASIPIPAIYDKALVMYVVAQAWAKSNQMEKSAKIMALYQAELDRSRQDFLTMPKEPTQ
ncbi:MAG: hypothetical protein JRI53_01515 [Deltaproteobacteria bacterium]|nr:hypothetical protein [Deltaproteobacteria bacterium]MBW2178767.1 hypothetical protein [Deltaproteobacteria bacterium]MBW2363478.1 hypothetical protein [Deltaproteobacteria bacterium]